LGTFLQIMKYIKTIKKSKFSPKVLTWGSIIILLYVSRSFIRSTFRNVFGVFGTEENEKPEYSYSNYNHQKQSTLQDITAKNDAEKLYSYMYGFGNYNEEITDIIYNSSDIKRLVDAFQLRDYDINSDLLAGEFIDSNLQPLQFWINKEVSDYWDYNKHEFTNDESYLEVIKELFKKQNIKF